MFTVPFSSLCIAYNHLPYIGRNMILYAMLINISFYDIDKWQDSQSGSNVVGPMYVVLIWKQKRKKKLIKII